MRHKITSDKHGSFIRNIKSLEEILLISDKFIYKMKIIMKTYNNDHSGYKPVYVGYFWDKNINSTIHDKKTV